MQYNKNNLYLLYLELVLDSGFISLFIVFVFIVFVFIVFIVFWVLFAGAFKQCRQRKEQRRLQ